jgi:VWFA-related protein
MRSVRVRTECSRSAAFLLFLAAAAPAQEPTPLTQSGPAAYTLSVGVNEVKITFHALDAHSRAVTDLKPSEIDVFEDGQGPGPIISLRHIEDRPLRMAVLLDISGSVGPHRARNRTLAAQAIQTLITHPQDAGAVIDFELARAVRQDWTNEPSSIEQAIDATSNDLHRWPGGTALYETLLTTCAEQFRDGAATGAGNVILLFSDGEDNVSHVTMQAAIDKCRSNNTVIYTFSSKPPSLTPESGSATLQALAERTGGRAFSLVKTEDEAHTAIETLEADLQSEYLLMYRPRKLRHDGAFHRIMLVGPDRVASMVSTPGFYDIKR